MTLVRKRRFTLRIVGGFFLLSFLLGGCANQPAKVTVPLVRHSSVHGGQQPVIGAKLQLYAVGTTGDGLAASALLTQAVTSDANGNFDITGAYTCPSASALVYITATGGNPGLSAGTNNAALALMAALGPCGNLGLSTLININELTTVAAVWSLAPFMSSYSNIGSGTTDAAGLAGAFTLAAEYVNTTTGTAPGLNVPAGTTVPVAQLNTLADILSSCVNSAGGVAGDGSACGTLFAAATPSSGTPPVDVIGAGLNIANNPTANVSSLFGLVTATAPFQPMLSVVPVDWTIKLMATSALSISPSAIAFPSTISGFRSAPQSATLTNTGGATILLTGLSIVGINAGDFSQSNNCPASLTSGALCTVQLAFTPSAAGTRDAYLSIVSGATNSSQPILLTGVGANGSTAGPITLLPSSLNFTQVGIPQTLTLTNNGSTPLAIAGVTLDASWTQTNNCGSVLDAQSICSIMVSSTSLSTNSRTGQLKVVDDAVDSPETISLSTNSNVNVSGAPIMFGSWALGTQNIPTQPFSVNTGTYYAFTSLNASIIGINASDFSLPSGSGCLYVQYECAITIGFAPGAVGVRTATLVTNYGNIALIGTGDPLGASFVIAPTNNNLGGFPIRVNLNTSFLPLPFTVTNNGSTTLQLGIAVSGTNASDFSVTSTCGSLAPVGTCSLGVIFTPSQVGLRLATLTVTDTVSGQQQTLALSGIGYYPPPSATPSNLTFGATQVGATSAAQTLMVSAPNGDPVRAYAYQGGTSFPLDTGSCLSGTPCQILVSFHPTVTGNSYQNLELTDEITGYSTVVSFAGSGGLPEVSLSSYSLTFPARNQGTTSIPQPITLTNTGNASLTISGISIAGANSGDFSIQSNACGSSVAVGGNCTISVSFSPTASGARNAILQIVSNAASSPDSVQLLGSGN